MPLIINQGVQDTTQDNKFNPIVAKDVLLEIYEINLVPGVENTLEFTFRVIEGQYKNRFVFDRVQYAKTAQYDMTWKYRALRACAGVPYDKNEPASIDIEKLLLHKAIKADLGIRKGKNKDGEDTEYQDVKYKKPKTATPAPVVNPTEATGGVVLSTNVEEIFGDDTTFVEEVSALQTQPTPAPTYQEPVLNVSDEAEWD